MNSELSLTISRSTIVDQVASFLYATGAVKHSQEIENIDWDMTGYQDPVKLHITLKEVHKPN